MSIQTLKEFIVEWRKGYNPITGERNLYKDMTDEIIWNAALKAATPTNSTNPPFICECGDHINPGEDYTFVNGKYFCKICL